MDRESAEREALASEYGTICDLVEAIWQKRKDEDYYNIDFDHLPRLTSPQARRVATFIMEMVLGKAEWARRTAVLMDSYSPAELRRIKNYAKGSGAAD